MCATADMEYIPVNMTLNLTGIRKSSSRLSLSVRVLEAQEPLTRARDRRLGVADAVVGDAAHDEDLVGEVRAPDRRCPVSSGRGVVETCAQNPLRTRSQCRV